MGMKTELSPGHPGVLPKGSLVCYLLLSSLRGFLSGKNKSWSAVSESWLRAALASMCGKQVAQVGTSSAGPWPVGLVSTPKGIGIKSQGSCLLGLVTFQRENKRVILQSCSQPKGMLLWKGVGFCVWLKGSETTAMEERGGGGGWGGVVLLRMYDFFSRTF